MSDLNLSKMNAFCAQHCVEIPNTNTFRNRCAEIHPAPQVEQRWCCFMKGCDSVTSYIATWVTFSRYGKYGHTNYMLLCWEHSIEFLLQNQPRVMDETGNEVESFDFEA